MVAVSLPEVDRTQVWVFLVAVTFVWERNAFVEMVSDVLEVVVVVVEMTSDGV